MLTAIHRYSWVQSRKYLTLNSKKSSRYLSKRKVKMANKWLLVSSARWLGIWWSSRSSKRDALGLMTAVSSCSLSSSCLTWNAWERALSDGASLPLTPSYLLSISALPRPIICQETSQLLSAHQGYIIAMATIQSILVVLVVTLMLEQAGFNLEWEVYKLQGKEGTS